MKTNNIISIERYTPDKNDRFLFDTNVWMYLYFPVGNYKKNIIRQYSKFFKKIIDAKASIYITSMIISEFFNSYVRREFKIRNKQDPYKYADFKEDFRSTVDYKDLMKILKSTYKKLEKICKKLDDDFKKIDMDKVLKDMEKFDFNDKYCICLAEMKNLKIVTHDKDFMISQVPIITANRSLLRKK